jgi:uncharacterized protein YigE (DUF2233 family)
MKPLLVFLSAALALVSSVSGVEFSTAEIAGKPLTVCRVNLRKERLQLFLRDDAGQPIKRFERLVALLGARGQKLTFAMNAGMYHADFSPVGLFVSDGKQLSPLNTANAEGNFFLKPNGVFVITETGARVVETSEFPGIRERVILATQSGPMLVHRGKLHPAFNAKSESRLFRNGVCAPSPDVVVFVNSEAPVNFYEFASFFRDTLRCTEALFLDGTINSLHSTELKRSDFRLDLGPIIGITE